MKEELERKKAKMNPKIKTAKETRKNNFKYGRASQSRPRRSPSATNERTK